MQPPGPVTAMAVIHIQNVVASTSIGEELDLNAISATFSNAEYEPEQFPGLVYRLTDPKVVVLIFGSGKLVCTGARKKEDAEEAVDKITAELSSLGLLF